MIDLGIGNLRIKKAGKSGIYALFKGEELVSPLTNLEEHLASMIEELKQRLAAPESRICKWQEDSDPDNNFWDGECGAVWEFIADGPIENKCNFCPECGGKLVISERPKREGDIILPQEMLNEMMLRPGEQRERSEHKPMRCPVCHEEYLGDGVAMCIDCEIGRKETAECQVEGDIK